MHDTATNTGGVLSNLSVYSAGKNIKVNDTIDIEEALGYPALSTRVSLNVEYYYGSQGWGQYNHLLSHILI